MHTIIVVKAKKNVDYVFVNIAVKNVVEKYTFFSPFDFCFIVNVGNTEEYEQLLLQIQAVGQALKDRLEIIISPPMKGGRYDGILPVSKWDEINKLTEE